MDDAAELEDVRHAPASPQTRALERTLRRTWIPMARAWRLTPRGIWLLKRITEPSGRVPVLRGSRVEPTRIGGRPAEWVRAPRALAEAGEASVTASPPGAAGARPAAAGAAPRPVSPDAPIALYLHGGGYVFGSPRTHRSLVSRLSHVSGLAVLSLDYRLPPEAILPAPIEDALAAYRELLDRGHRPERIVVAGDSAGGNLALNLALHAAEAGLPRPAALVLLSPWADLTLSSSSFRDNALLDPFIPPDALRRFAWTATGGADPADWRASPLFAPEQLWRSAIPPTQVHAGSTEILLDDARAVARRVAAAGTRAELHVYDRQPHVVPLWAGTPEARTAMRLIGQFTSSVLAPESAPTPPTSADAASAAAPAAEAPQAVDAPRS